MDESELDLKKVEGHHPSWMARLQQSPTVEASRWSPRIRKTFETLVTWNWLTGPVDRRPPNAWLDDTADTPADSAVRLVNNPGGKKIRVVNNLAGGAQSILSWPGGF